MLLKPKRLTLAHHPATNYPFVCCTFLNSPISLVLRLTFLPHFVSCCCCCRFPAYWVVLNISFCPCFFFFFVYRSQHVYVATLNNVSCFSWVYPLLAAPEYCLLMTPPYFICFVVVISQNLENALQFILCLCSFYSFITLYLLSFAAATERKCMRRLCHVCHVCVCGNLTSLRYFTTNSPFSWY